MTGPDEFVDTYFLPRDKFESSRLERQHECIVTNLGFLLHPRIEKALPQDARIADVATGTGIWLNSVAKTAPSTWSLTGLDLSDAQFPPPSSRGRCNYETLNMLQPIPDHLKQSFDLVHIRYLILALTTGQWETIARNAFELLKPGGYLQWHESNFCDIISLQSKAGDSVDALRTLMRVKREVLRQQDKFLPGIIDPGLRQSVEKTGFTEVDEEIIASDRVVETRKEGSIVGVLAVKALILMAQETLRERGIAVHEQAWVEAECEKAMKEVEMGGYLWWSMHVVTARRPLA